VHHNTRTPLPPLTWQETRTCTRSMAFLKAIVDTTDGSKSACYCFNARTTQLRDDHTRGLSNVNGLNLVSNESASTTACSASSVSFTSFILSAPDAAFLFFGGMFPISLCLPLDSCSTCFLQFLMMAIHRLCHSVVFSLCFLTEYCSPFLDFDRSLFLSLYWLSCFVSSTLGRAILQQRV